MKYIKVVLVITILLITGCNKKEKEPVKEIEDVQEEVIDNYVDNNPIILGIYENDYSLVKDYYTTKIGDKDLFFTTYYTNDDALIGGRTKYKWYEYYNKYDNIENYKIGYNISFKVGEEEISKNITYIEDEYIFDPYFYVYLYDDIHQLDGAWYSHITKDKVNDNTIFTSIKIYLVEPAGITSPITLTAFTYDSEDDFDTNGNYRGISKYQITINWK